MQQNLYDDCFYIEKSKWGTVKSVNKDGKYIITSLSEDECIRATRFYLKGMQEGFSEEKAHQGTVDGKL